MDKELEQNIIDIANEVIATYEICHPTTNTDEIDHDTEADIFAAAFLMPEPVFHDVCTHYIEGSRVNISKVADEFRVTNSDACYRAKLLSYTLL